jgi:hypothetical protein
MSDYDAMALELAEKHDAFYAHQMVNMAKDYNVPVDELDLWMQAMRRWQPCLFKAHIVGGVNCPDDDVKVREYMKKLLARESNAEVKGKGALA